MHITCRCSHTLKIILQDDCLPMWVEKPNERDSVLVTIWLRKEEREQLVKYDHFRDLTLENMTHHTHYRSANLPSTLPWSQGFYLCCQDVSSSESCVAVGFTYNAVLDTKLRSKLLPVYRRGVSTSPEYRRST